jgi:hypothetical protein
VFSLGQGIIHPYYTVALAPAIGAVVGIGASTLWERRHGWMARTALAAALAATAIWAYILLGRTPTWLPWLRTTELVAGLAVAALIVAWTHLRGRLSAVVAAAAIVVALAGPAAYTLATVSTAHSGAIPAAGPSGAGGGFGPGGGGGGRGGRFTAAGARAAFGTTGAGAALPAGGSSLPAGATSAGNGRPSGGFGGGGFGGGAGGANIGGLLNGSKPSAALTAALELNASHYTWVAAAVGSNEAAGYQLATGQPVMAIGGFNGTDPAPTLAQFERYVQEGRIHYFIAGGGGGAPGGGGGTTSVSSQITTWVEAHFTAKTVGGVTLYDLTSATKA